MDPVIPTTHPWRKKIEPETLKQREKICQQNSGTSTPIIRIAGPRSQYELRKPNTGASDTGLASSVSRKAVGRE